MLSIHSWSWIHGKVAMFWSGSATMGRQRLVVAFVPLWSLGPGMAGWAIEEGPPHCLKQTHTFMILPSSGRSWFVWFVGGKKQWWHLSKGWSEIWHLLTVGPILRFGGEGAPKDERYSSEQDLLWHFSLTDTVVPRTTSRKPCSPSVTLPKTSLQMWPLRCPVPCLFSAWRKTWRRGCLFLAENCKEKLQEGWCKWCALECHALGIQWRSETMLTCYPAKQRARDPATVEVFKLSAQILPEIIEMTWQIRHP